MIFAGGVLSWLVTIPMIKFFGSGLTKPIFPGTVPINSMDSFAIWNAYIRPIGAGAVSMAGLFTLSRTLPTIVKAIREGRVIFGNIRRFVAYLLSCNLSEVSVVGLAILFALPLPILPLQILYLNLVTDVFPAFALAMGEGDRGVLERRPRDPKEPIVGRAQWTTIVLQSITLSAATFGALVLARQWLDLDSRSVVTVTFLTLAFAQLWHVFNMRHPRSGLLRNEVTRNPWLWGALALCIVLVAAPPYVAPLAHVLALVPPTPAMWAIILGMSMAPLIVTQVVVTIRTWRQAKHSGQS
jgi:Ca2+-transporting ATPase